MEKVKITLEGIKETPIEIEVDRGFIVIADGDDSLDFYGNANTTFILAALKLIELQLQEAGYK